MLNKMLVIGNVGRDPEMRYTPNGNAVTSFSLAVNQAIHACRVASHRKRLSGSTCT